MASPPPYEMSPDHVQLRTNTDYKVDATASHSFALSWDCIDGQDFDLDIQAILVDFNGAIIDAAYFNNLKAGGRAVTHSGDETTGKPEWIDEKLSLHFSKLTQTNVQVVLIVVSAFARGSFAQVKNATAKLLNESNNTIVATYDLKNGGSNTACILSVVHRPNTPGSNQWSIKTVDEPHPTARHFMDMLPALAKHIQVYNPRAPSVQRCQFSMSKGGVVDFASEMTMVAAGLGWDATGGGIDLDVSCVMFDSQGKHLETVFFGNLKSLGPHSAPGAVQHSGDNLTGEGAGDDERITLNLASIGPSVTQVFFCINIYTRGRSFRDVSNPYCRVMDNSNQELCRYKLNEAPQCSGLIISRIVRDPRTSRWGFHALGLPSNGTMWKDSLPDMEKIFFQKTAQFADPLLASVRGSHVPPPMPHAQQAAPTQIVVNMQQPQYGAPPPQQYGGSPQGGYPQGGYQQYPPPQQTQKSNDSCCVVM